MPSAFQSPALDAALRAVQTAWTEASARQDPELATFLAALHALADLARDEGVPVTDLLKAADSLARPGDGGDGRLDWDHARERAGRHLIPQYYRHG